MGLVELAWVIIIVLKLAGIAFVATSWWLVILWPIAAYAVIIAVVTVLGVSLSSLAFWRRKR